MSKIVLRNNSKAPARKSGGLRIGGAGSSTSLATPTNPSTPKTSGLAANLAKAQDRAAFRQRPLLVYLIVDLTSSRRDTRATMRPHEHSLAQMIMNAGGNHPVVCKGVLHTGGHCSAPKLLKDEDAVLRFLDTPPQAGLTSIAPALQHYMNDDTNDVLSLGVLVGDAYDGDSASNLIDLAKRLKTKKRPLVIAHQETGSDDFCTNVAPAMAKAGEGLEFSLGDQPKELHALLDNYGKILTATPDELKATAQGHTSSGVKLSGGAATQRFAEQQAQLLLTKD